MTSDRVSRHSSDSAGGSESEDKLDLDAEHDAGRARRVSTAALLQEQAKHEETKARGLVGDGRDHQPAGGPAHGAGNQLHDETTVAAGEQTKPAETQQAAPAAASPGQLIANPAALHLNAVAGRSTLGVPVEITNLTDRYLAGRPRIEALDDSVGAFSIDAEGAGFMAPPERDNKDRGVVSVRYHPRRAGSHSGTLILPTEIGEVRVPIDGSALDIGSHAKTVGEGAAPEPVHELGDKEPQTRAEGRAQAMDAADAVSSLARTTDELLAQGDVARDQFGSQLLAAGASLNARILGWVQAEGLDRAEKIRQDSQGQATDFIKYVAGKTAGATLKALEKENVITEYALEAIDLGLNVYFGNSGNKETDARAAGYGEHMSGVMGMAIPATDAATQALAMRFASLMGRYAVARSHMIDHAGQSAGRSLGSLFSAIQTNNLDKQKAAIADAHTVVNDFNLAKDAWSGALKQIAAAGIGAQQVVVAGFARLIEHYIEFRAAGNREIEPHERQVSGSGWLDFNDRWNIQLTGFTFGKFQDASPVVQSHIDQKRLADLGAQQGNPPRPGWGVTIRLADVNHDGAVVLTQGAAGPAARAHKIEGDIEGRLHTIGGVEKLWALLDSATLGTRVIWGGTP